MRSDLITPDEYIPRELVELTHRSVTPEQFERLCSEYSDWRLELTSSGESIVMPGTGGLTGIRNSNLTYQLEAWSQINGTGVCFDSSTIFALPNQARRSPDASWVKRERWDSLTDRQQETFPPICPDFVIELRSSTDRLPQVCDKMVEYLENGALLGWLIDPFEFRVYVYRPGHELVILENPDTVSADPLLPGFTLNVMKLW